MDILYGKKRTEMTGKQLAEKAEPYRAVHVDIGTGTGTYICRQARENPDILYLGIDPAAENMYDSSTKIIKKKQKGGLENVLFVIASIEQMPRELDGMADSVSVILPWGSLLESVVKPIASSLEAIARISRQGAAFEFVTTYSDSFEQGEMERRGLPRISEAYFQAGYQERLKDAGLVPEHVERLTNAYIRTFPSKWAKQLASGREREFFRITGFIDKNRVNREEKHEDTL